MLDLLQVLALSARRKKLDQGHAGGQTVDVSIMERSVVPSLTDIDSRHSYPH